MLLVVAIPAFNEEETIGETIRRIPASIPGVDRVSAVVIDDGSRDETALRSSGAGARVISHGTNRGLGQAFRSAIDAALSEGADVLVTIDADGQFNPRDIPLLLSPIQKGGADVVTASRFVEKGYVPEHMPAAKIAGNHFMAWFLSTLTGKKFRDASCGFRAYSAEALCHLNLFGEFTYTQESLLDLTFKGLRIKEVPVRVTYFKGRKSRIAGNLFRYGWRTLKIIFRTLRDYRPLRFFGFISFVFFGMGLVFDFFILAHFIETGGFAPYRSAAFIGGFLNAVGIGVFILALLADMLVRIRMNQERMLYYERKRQWAENR